LKLTLINLIFYDLLNVYHVTLNVTGKTHAKFDIFSRSDFVSGLLSGFTKPPFRISKCCTWTQVAMGTVAVL